MFRARSFWGFSPNLTDPIFRITCLDRAKSLMALRAISMSGSLTLRTAEITHREIQR